MDKKWHVVAHNHLVTTVPGGPTPSSNLHGQNAHGTYTLAHNTCTENNFFLKEAGKEKKRPFALFHLNYIKTFYWN